MSEMDDEISILRQRVCELTNAAKETSPRIVENERLRVAFDAMELSGSGVCDVCSRVDHIYEDLRLAIKGMTNE